MGRLGRSLRVRERHDAKQRHRCCDALWRLLTRGRDDETAGAALRAERDAEVVAGL